MATIQECCQQYWTIPGGNTPQSSSCTATYLPSRKLSKLDEPDKHDTAREVGKSSQVMFSYGPLHMVEQKLGDQLEPTYNSSVRGVAQRSRQKRWRIGRGGERGSGISVVMAWQDDDNEYIYMCVCVCVCVFFFSLFNSISTFVCYLILKPSL